MNPWLCYIKQKLVLHSWTKKWRQIIGKKIQSTPNFWYLIYKIPRDKKT